MFICHTEADYLLCLHVKVVPMVRFCVEKRLLLKEALENLQ